MIGVVPGCSRLSDKFTEIVDGHSQVNCLNVRKNMSEYGIVFGVNHCDAAVGVCCIAGDWFCAKAFEFVIDRFTDRAVGECYKRFVEKSAACLLQISIIHQIKQSLQLYWRDFDMIFEGNVQNVVGDI